MRQDVFIRAKNVIVFRVTSVILVPEAQIINEPFHKLGPLLHGDSLSASICPYCVSRRDSIYDTLDCSTCPMAMASNQCGTRRLSTWGEASHIWDNNATHEDIKELEKLVATYNSSNIHWYNFATRLYSDLKTALKS